MNPKIARLFNAIKKSKATLVVSPHHTGTWFALEFLLWHSRFCKVVELNDALWGNHPLHSSCIIHLHLAGNGINSRGVIKGISIDDVAQLVRFVPTLIPIRDPMSAIISRQERHPGFDHTMIVDAFTHLWKFNPSAWLPVDLLGSYHDRLNLLSDTLQRLGLNVEPYIYRYARDWTPQNTRGDYELKHIYANGDLEGLRNRMPVNFDYLIMRRHEIAPFMAKRGYPHFSWEDYR